MIKFKKWGLLLLVLFMTIACDQVTKKIASENLSPVSRLSYLGDTFRLQYVKNDGSFLSIGSDWPTIVKILVLNIIPVLLLSYICFYLIKTKNIEPVSFIALSLILGGGISNIGDRLLHNGFVIDFMNVGIGSLRTGIFNFADMFIMAGCGILIFITFNKKRSQNTDNVK